MNLGLSDRHVRWHGSALVIVAGCLICMIGYGVRSVFGLFLTPMTLSVGWDRETFALAMAIQQLLWGLMMPVAGMIADRYGYALVVAGGAVIYAFGILGMAFTESVPMLHLSGGVLAGASAAGAAVAGGAGAGGCRAPQAPRGVLATRR